jgi:RHS repeat-associated protein
VTKYIWRSDDRLIQVQQGASTATLHTIAQYQYDDNGNRSQRTAYVQDPANPGSTALVPQTTNYLIDESYTYAETLEETQSTNAGQATRTLYTWDDDNRIQSASQSNFNSNGLTQNYYEQDGLGSVVSLSDQSGNLTKSYQYGAFGEANLSGQTDVNPYRYAGEYTDAAIALQFNRERWYGSSIGRFISQDHFSGVATNVITLNKYSYASDDPVSGSDPTGNYDLQQMAATLAVAGITNAAIGVGINMVNPNATTIWGNFGRDCIIGAVTAPVGGVLGRVLGPVLVGLRAPLLRAVGQMDRLTLVGRPAMEKFLIRLSRTFVTTNRGYPSVKSTLMGKALITVFPWVKWEMHHIYIQQSWFRVGSPNQLYTSLLENQGLRRIGNAGWNLMPIPASLNGWLGRSAVNTQLFSTFIYAVAVFGPIQVSEAVSEASAGE